MINYKEYEQKVYNWLNNKNKQDPNFTFSLRQNESKGAELHYFMGGEKSRYLTTTFWNIPAGNRGSLSNCISLVFMYSADYLKYNYDFLLRQTNFPKTEQNISVLNLIKSLVDPLKDSIGISSKGNREVANLEIRTRPQKKGYTNLDEMLRDIDEDLSKFIPIVNKHIAIEKKVNPEFEAHRITKEEFTEMQVKLQTRFEKYGSLKNQIKKAMNLKDEFAVWLLKKPKSNYFNNDKEKLIRYLDTYNTFFDIDIFEVSELNFKEIINEIDKEAYQDENSKFFIYSDGESNHRPRAILGKTNYYQFLKEKFKMKNNEENIFDLYLQYLKDTREGEIGEGTMEGYAETASIKIKERWNETFKEPFDSFTINLINLKKVAKLLDKGFSGYTSFRPFINQLISDFTEVETAPLNQILYGPPGTGKTFNTINKAIEIINPTFDFEQDRKIIREEYNRLVEEGQIVFATFHQSMSYEDFIEGIKPDVNAAKNVIYDITPGVFKNISECARNNWLDAKKGTIKELSFEEAFTNLKDEWEENVEMKFPLKTKGKDYTILDFTKASIHFKKFSGTTNHTMSISTLRDLFYGLKEVKHEGVGVYYPSLITKLKSYQSEELRTKEEKSYVLIIDEINRGNVSAIFGELITLIENDKRLGNKEALSVVLPYSKEPFSVPNNLYLIGTMNTADRSVEALDTALRRRFSFEEMMPKPALVKTEGQSGTVGGVIENIDLEKLLITINNRIEKLIDRDHKIGHSYFLVVDSLEKLKNCFQNKIIPLLQEYFFGDYGKIGLVLGEGFFENNIENREEVFANFTINDYDADGLSDRQVFHLLNAIDMEDNDFLSAIDLLIGNKSA